MRTLKFRRILLADDHILVLEALRTLLAPHFNVVGTATDGLALLERAKALHPDVVVLDVGMPLLNGFEAARRLEQTLPTVKVVFLTVHDDPLLAIQALRDGASGYLLKTSAAESLVQAIQAALRNESYVTPEIARRMQEVVRNPEGQPISRKLTKYQQNVLQLLVRGKSMKEAASVLAVSPRTIAFHKYKMMKTLGIKNTAALIRYAVQNDMLRDRFGLG
jgi:DNA-binding NarL/FixJ family response regulator